MNTPAKQESKADKPKATPRPHICRQCQQVFGTGKALAEHREKAHGL